MVKKDADLPSNLNSKDKEKRRHTVPIKARVSSAVRGTA